jgi:hypothetical protein
VRTLGTADYDYYLAADAVYPLFRYDTPLQNPELVIRRLIGTRTRKALSGRVLKEVRALLKVLLQLRGKDQLQLKPTGIVVAGPWGWSELNALGDGYRGTVTWVLDLLSWWFIKQEQEGVRGDRTKVGGVVLLDEAEQHLHPRWQRVIVRLLRASFPRVQFVATTHSPLVASGCEDVAVHHLDGGRHTIEHPYGWLAEDVYEMMGIESSRAEPFRTEVLDQFKRLDAKRIDHSATKGELKTLTGLKRQLDRLPGSDSVRLFAELDNIQRAARQLTGKTDKHTNAKR